MSNFNSNLVFWIGLRTLGLILAVTVLPITIILRLGNGQSGSVVAFVGIAFSLIMNVYGIYIHFLTKKNKRSDHCPASSIAILDLICFVCFVIASAIFVHEHINRFRDPGSELFDGKDIPALVIYFGLALLHFVLTIYDCVETFQSDRNQDVEVSATPEAARDVEATPGQSHLATRTQRVWLF